MMFLYEKIIAIYPDLTPQDFMPGGAISLRNDGDGDFIERWDHPTHPRPTAAQIATATPSPAVPAIPYTRWLALFTPAERAWAFSNPDPRVMEFITVGVAAGSIHLGSKAVSDFLDLCVALGGLAPARKAKIVAGETP